MSINTRPNAAIKSSSSSNSFFSLKNRTQQKSLETMKFLIFLSVIALASAQCTYNELKECNTIEKNIVDKKFPDNEADVKKFCENLFKGGKCLREKAKICLKGDLLKLANEILDAEKTTLTDLCTNGVQQFIDDVKNCFNKDNVLTGLEDIHTRYVDLVESAQKDDKSTYIQSFCCTQLYSRDHVRDLNTQQCGADIAKRLDNLLKNSVGNIFHSRCGKSASYEECALSLPEKIRSDFDAIIKAAVAPTPEHPFAVPTLIEMAHDLNN